MAIKKVKDMNENEEQVVICQWCKQNNLIAVAVPNGFNLNASAQIMRKYGLSSKELATQNAIQMRMLKREGLHVGFCDLMIFGEKDGRGQVLYMENKVKNNKPSPYQLACHEWLRELGFVVEVSKNSIDAIAKIKAFFGLSEQAINKKYIEKRKSLI